MIVRPFLNSDPPALMAIWNAQPDQKHVARQLNLATLECFVLAKPYFDRQGLLIATEGDRVVGFAHAGFGPNGDRTDIDRQTGVICAVQILPDWNLVESNRQLIRAAEQYLFERGVQRILGGPVSPYECFYHGLASTGEAVGVPMGDAALREAYGAMGYAVGAENVLLRRDLSEYRPPFDRRQRALQRNYEVLVELDSGVADWWDLCRYGPLPRCEFHLLDRLSRARLGQVIWWDQAFSGASLQSAVAFTQLEIAREYRRQGFGTLLLTEAMKQLKASGALQASTQVDAGNESALAFFRAIEFEESTRGTTFVKSRADS